MRTVDHGGYMEVFLTKEEALELCKPGQGADTCIWLCVGAEGFECLYYQRDTTLVERLNAGETVAKRTGCERITEIYI